LVPLAIQARVKRLHMPRSLVWSLYMDTNLEKKYKYNDPIIFSWVRPQNGYDQVQMKRRKLYLVGYKPK
jgi:hypothetical protein